MENPLFRKYPEWEPDALPAVRSAGDLQVRLASFATGYDPHVIYRSLADGKTVVEHGTNRVDGRNYSAASLETRSRKGTNEVWQVAGVEVSDATGNLARNSSLSLESGAQACSFRPSLWPGEKAWKIHLELKRAGGFGTDELVAFKDVPLGEIGQTNRFDWRTNMAGVGITLSTFSRKPAPPGNSWSSGDLSTLAITHSSLPEGSHLDLVSLIVDSGETVRTVGWSSSGTDRAYRFTAIPDDAKKADFIFAVHQSRRVDFLVEPRLP